MKYVGIVDLTKCDEKQKENLGWLALAMHLADKKCPICGLGWNCRQDVIDRGAICGYDGDAVCEQHWQEYLTKRKPIKL